jgi:hypothetical protein
MEAATPLRKAHVRTIGDRLVVDGLVIDDECAVRLVREREETGADPVRVVADAVEIGARVLDREQAGANAEFVRNEFDKVSREVEEAFTERARAVGEELSKQLDQVFSPDSGHLTKAFERHFSDGSSAAVQHRVNEVVRETMARAQQELLQQFSSSDGKNPLAHFTSQAVSTLRQASQRQDTNLLAIQERMAALQQEVHALRAEREKLEELDAERERGTAKGRTFEEQVVEAVDRIASLQGDDCDAVGDQRGATGRVGDVVVALDACNGPARGSIVFEVKTGKLSKPDALRELDRAKEDRSADFAVLVVPNEAKVPARMRQLREYNGDKLIVAFDPDAEGTIALEVAYSLARARVLMSRSETEGVDAKGVRDSVERALNAMERVRAVKNTLTGAQTQIGKAKDVIDDMAEQVREHLRTVDQLVLAGSPDAVDPDSTERDRPKPAQESLV